MKLILKLSLAVLLFGQAYADYGSYMQEKEEFRATDEGGAVIDPGWGGGFEEAPENADPAYDSTVDEDMLFDSYHNQ